MAFDIQDKFAHMPMDKLALRELRSLKSRYSNLVRNKKFDFFLMLTIPKCLHTYVYKLRCISQTKQTLLLY